MHLIISSTANPFSILCRSPYFRLFLIHLNSGLNSNELSYLPPGIFDSLSALEQLFDIVVIN